jgi:DNA-binding response OmpR family regulator
MPPVRLLCIEDDADVAELLVTYFRMMQYDVIHAPDGVSGLNLARSEHPNLILLDVMLPDLTGWEVATRLRASALTRYIPILFLTQRIDRQDKLLGLRLGADDYITKPFAITELLLRAQTAGRRATRQHLYEPRTGLPGSPLIQAELRRLRHEQGWSHFRIRLDGLAEFREIYGFIAANEALAFAARVVQQAVREQGTPDDFVGIGDGDDLVLLTRAGRPEQIRAALQADFAAGVRSLYTFRDAERGAMLLHPGTPQETRVPLMALRMEAVGGVARSG